MRVYSPVKKLFSILLVAALTWPNQAAALRPQNPQDNAVLKQKLRSDLEEKSSSVRSGFVEGQSSHTGLEETVTDPPALDADLAWRFYVTYELRQYFLSERTNDTQLNALELVEEWLNGSDEDAGEVVERVADALGAADQEYWKQGIHARLDHLRGILSGEILLPDHLRNRILTREARAIAGLLQSPVFNLEDIQKNLMELKDHPILPFQEIKGIVDEGRPRWSTEQVAQLFRQAGRVRIFGSFAQAALRPQSDLDIIFPVSPGGREAKWWMVLGIPLQPGKEPTLQQFEKWFADGFLSAPTLEVPADQLFLFDGANPKNLRVSSDFLGTLLAQNQTARRQIRATGITNEWRVAEQAAILQQKWLDQAGSSTQLRTGGLEEVVQEGILPIFTPEFRNQIRRVILMDHGNSLSQPLMNMMELLPAVWASFPNAEVVLDVAAMAPLVRAPEGRTLILKDFRNGNLSQDEIFTPETLVITTGFVDPRFTNEKNGSLLALGHFGWNITKYGTTRIRFRSQGEDRSIQISDPMGQRAWIRQRNILRKLGFLISLDLPPNILTEREFSDELRGEILRLRNLLWEPGDAGSKPLLVVNPLKSMIGYWAYGKKVGTEAEKKWFSLLERVVREFDVTVLINPGPVSWNRNGDDYQQLVRLRKHLASLENRRAKVVDLEAIGLTKTTPLTLAALLFLAKETGGALLDVQTGTTHLADWMDAPEVLLALPETMFQLNLRTRDRRVDVPVYRPDFSDVEPVVTALEFLISNRVPGADGTRTEQAGLEETPGAMRNPDPFLGDDPVFGRKTYQETSHRITVALLGSTPENLQKTAERLRQQLGPLSASHSVEIVAGVLDSQEQFEGEFVGNIPLVRAANQSELLFEMTRRARETGSTLIHVMDDQIGDEPIGLSQKLEQVMEYGGPSVFVSSLGMTFHPDAHFVMEKEPGKSFLDQLRPYQLASDQPAPVSLQSADQFTASAYSLQKAVSQSVVWTGSGEPEFLPSNGNVLFFEPHADDYALAATGLMKRLLLLEDKLRVYSFADTGRKGYWTLRDPKRIEENRAAFRTIQDQVSVGNKIRYWVFASETRSQEEAQLLEEFRILRPALLVIPALEDTHRTHVRGRELALKAARRYVQEMGKSLPVIQVPLFSAETPAYASANGAFLLTQPELDQENQVLAAFESQADYVQGPRFGKWQERNQARAQAIVETARERKLPVPDGIVAAEPFWYGTLTAAAGLEENEVLSQSVAELWIESAIRKVIAREGIRTIGELAQRNRQQFLALNNMGEARVQRLENELASLRVYLVPSVEAVSVSNPFHVEDALMEIRRSFQEGEIEDVEFYHDGGRWLHYGQETFAEVPAPTRSPMDVLREVSEREVVRIQFDRKTLRVAPPSYFFPKPRRQSPGHHGHSDLYTNIQLFEAYRSRVRHPLWNPLEVAVGIPSVAELTQDLQRVTTKTFSESGVAARARRNGRYLRPVGAKAVAVPMLRKMLSEFNQAPENKMAPLDFSPTEILSVYLAFINGETILPAHRYDLNRLFQFHHLPLLENSVLGNASTDSDRAGLEEQRNSIGQLETRRVVVDSSVQSTRMRLFAQPGTLPQGMDPLLRERGVEIIPLSEKFDEASSTLNEQGARSGDFVLLSSAVPLLNNQQWNALFMEKNIPALQMRGNSSLSFSELSAVFRLFLGEPGLHSILGFEREDNALLLYL